MSFRLDPAASSLKDEIRRIAREQFASAVEKAGDVPSPRAVHDVRRRLKRLRGLLRLVRPRLDDYDELNAALRDLARSISGARDEAVMRKTLASLELNGQDAGSIEAFFGGGQDDAASISHDDWSRLRAALDAGREAAGDWRLRGPDSFGLLLPGLGTVYARLREGYRRVREKRDAAVLHAWRKAAKYHWHHLSLLRPIGPEIIGARCTLASELETVLGDHHDLAVLAERIRDRQAEAALNAIAARQSGLETRALDLGRQLTIDKPGAFATHVARLARSAD